MSDQLVSVPSARNWTLFGSGYGWTECSTLIYNLTSEAVYIRDHCVTVIAAQQLGGERNDAAIGMYNTWHNGHVRIITFFPSTGHYAYNIVHPSQTISRVNNN